LKVPEHLAPAKPKTPVIKRSQPKKRLDDMVSNKPWLKYQPVAKPPRVPKTPKEPE